MLTDYIKSAMAEAQYKMLEDGSFFGEIPSCQGVYANDPKLEACRTELQEVLEDWLLLRFRAGHKIPTVANIDLNSDLSLEIEDVA
jgi:predicted RNase H-like HicB family nuclease